MRRRRHWTVVVCRTGDKNGDEEKGIQKEEEKRQDEEEEGIKEKRGKTRGTEINRERQRRREISQKKETSTTTTTPQQSQSRYGQPLTPSEQGQPHGTSDQDQHTTHCIQLCTEGCGGLTTCLVQDGHSYSLVGCGGGQQGRHRAGTRQPFPLVVQPR